MDHLDERIYDLFNHLDKALSEFDGTEFKRHFVTTTKNYTLIMEAVILKNGELLAVLESRPYVEKLELSEILERGFTKDLGYKYLIITNGIEIFLFNTYNGSYHMMETINQLITSIFNLPTEEKIQAIKAQIAQVLEQESRNFIDQLKMTFRKIKKYQLVKDHFTIQRTFHELHFDRNGQFFRLGTDITMSENFENLLFNILLEDLQTGTLIYRYASLETVFATINAGSIRMNGIVGMNDTSEVEYVDRYLDKSYNLFTNPNEIKTMNKRFISCFSKLDDTLNQWRLYGDDCKGACLIFKINESQNSPGLKLKKVSYGSPSRHGQPYHTELELIKRLIEKVREITGESLKFKSMGIWKHFFKPYEYIEEKEIRLLMVLNNNLDIKGGNHTPERKWNLTSTHKIIAPFISVPLAGALPISLQQITLGSKSPEKQVNQAQLALLLEENGMLNVKVSQSAINNYR